MTKKIRKNRQPKYGRISRFAISRLYNMGNYENCKFELTVDLRTGEDATESFRNAFWILKMLAPLRVPSCKDEYERAIKATDEEQSEWQKNHIKEWAEEMAAFSEKKRLRTVALKAFSELGGVSKHTDAKNEWDDVPF